MIQRSNCLVWAWRKWRRDGGWLLIRKSAYTAFWHVAWMDAHARVIEEWAPLGAKVHQWSPPWWFAGEVKRRPLRREYPRESKE